MRPHNSQLVACGGEVVAMATYNAAAASDVAAAASVAAVHNACATGDVAAVVGIAAMDNVVVVVGVVAAVAIWVQRCLMRPCTHPQCYFLSLVVTPIGKKPSWWDR